MKSTIEMAKQSGFSYIEEDCIKHFAALVRAAALEEAAQAALEECPTPDGALCAAAIRQLKETK